MTFVASAVGPVFKHLFTMISFGVVKVGSNMSCIITVFFPFCLFES